MVVKPILYCTRKFNPKLLLRLPWFFRRKAALFSQIRTFPQLFRFCSDLGNYRIRQIVRNSMLTGRWWEGRISSARPCRPTFWHKLAQVEQVQAPSWYRACAMAQGMTSIVGIWLVPWHKERSLFTSPRPNGTGLVQPACLCQWDTSEKYTRYTVVF